MGIAILCEFYPGQVLRSGRRMSHGFNRFGFQSECSAAWHGWLDWPCPPPLDRDDDCSARQVDCCWFEKAGYVFRQARGTLRECDLGRILISLISCSGRQIHRLMAAVSSGIARSRRQVRRETGWDGLRAIHGQPSATHGRRLSCPEAALAAACLGRQ